MAKKEKRFVKVHSEDMGCRTVYVDRQTGVNYLYISSGYSGGLTPLLNRDGTPIVTPVPKNYEE